MFQLLKPDTNYKFVSKFTITSIISSLLVIGSLVFLFTQMKYGVDFRGGAEVQAKFNQAVSLSDLRKVFDKGGFESVTVQTIGEASENEVLIKVAATDENLNAVTQKVNDTLLDAYGDGKVNVRKVDIVGPKAGAQLRVSGFQAMAYALLAIMVYIGLRFDFKYSPGAIAALFHDVSIILGIFALSGTEFTLQTVAALLAVIGYSVNDTVIVYDRVREHEEKYAGRSLAEHINNAINETLSRTILTSGTTLFISMAMWIAGGEAIKDFFFAITLGVFIGTYSSIFVAAPVTLLFDRLKGTSASGTMASAK